MSIRSLWVPPPRGRSSLAERSRAPNASDRERAQPWSELADAVAGLGEGRSPEAVLADAVARVRRAVGAERAVVWLDIAGRVWPEVIDPAGVVVPRSAQLPAESDTCAAIRQGGERLGALQVTGSRLPEGTSTLLREVAAAAASLVRAVVVREALRSHVAETAAQHAQLLQARADLVTRQNAERRRVASDIHDGCQQRVTVIAGKVGLIRALLAGGGAEDRADAASLRHELDADLDDLVGALGAITTGRAPPRLGRSGLAAALRRDVRGLEFRVEVTGDPGPLPEPVEEAAYFCCLEAVQNAARHSGGRGAQVRLRREPAALVFTVIDDGSGFDANQSARGTGLSNLRRRVGELGGQLELVASARGTRLTGRLPLAGSD